MLALVSTSSCATTMWKRFVCVESAVVGAPVVLQPEEVWRGETNLTVVDL